MLILSLSLSLSHTHTHTHTHTLLTSKYVLSNYPGDLEVLGEVYVCSSVLSPHNKNLKRRTLDPRRVIALGQTVL